MGGIRGGYPISDWINVACAKWPITITCKSHNARVNHRWLDAPTTCKKMFYTKTGFSNGTCIAACIATMLTKHALRLRIRTQSLLFILIKLLILEDNAGIGKNKSCPFGRAERSLQAGKGQQSRPESLLSFLG